ncbi:efflux RND transporter periplasmic adaptor subunit [Thalassotalea aquiviva]|uniref:efflux RND transporter periplasmic adaptor subunit n=1 Tax=Thalassotalea aquiviva TaxID=3242415 RepID=UPI00352A79EB
MIAYLPWHNLNNQFAFFNQGLSKQINAVVINHGMFRLLLAALTLVALMGCNPNNNAANNVESAYHHKVAAHSLEPQQGYQVIRRFSGVIQSQQRAKVNVEVSGRVDQIAVFEGEKVEQGQVLAILNSELLEIEAKQLQAQLHQVEAQISLANANLARVQSLQPKGYSSEQVVDEVKSQLKSLSASKQQLQASIMAKQYQIDRTQIRAPYTGIINKRFINIGEVVNSQQVAFEIQQSGAYELKVGVPQHLIASIKQQSQYSLIINSSAFLVDHVAINTQINQASRTVQLRFAIPAQLEVFDNQKAYFEFAQYYPEPGYWIPISALTNGVRGTWNIYTLSLTTDSPNEGNELFTLVTQSVDVLHTETDKAYIKADLDSSLMFLVSGVQRLVPGQTVRIQ